MGARVFNGTDQYLTVDDVFGLTAAPITIGVWVKSDTTADMRAVAFADVGTNSNYLTVGTQNLDATYRRGSSGTGTAKVVVSTGDVVPLGEWHSLVGVYASNSSDSLYVDDSSGVDNTGSESFPTGLDNLTVGALRDNAIGQFFDGKIQYVFIWDVALSDAEAADFYAGNIPQQANLVEWWEFDGSSPEVGQVLGTELAVTGATFDGADSPPVSYGGAVAYEFEATAGTYALTGAATGVLSTRVIDAGLGSYALTGTAATPLATRMLSGDPGGYALTGAAVGLPATRLFPADPGTYILTGTAATTELGRVLSAEPGIYVLAGDGGYGGGYGWGYGDGAQLLADRLITATPGVYVLTGTDATFVYVPVVGAFVLEATAGSYTVTGFVAAPLADHLLNVDPGSYAVTGQAATVLADRLIAALAGSYTLTGVAAELLFSLATAYTLDAETGVYTLTGIAVTPVAARLFTLDPGSYTTTGIAAGTLAERMLNAATGTFAITGVVTGFRGDWLFNTSPGVYAITGLAADLEQALLLVAHIDDSLVLVPHIPD